MNINNKRIPTLIRIITIVAAAAILFVGAFAYQLLIAPRNQITTLINQDIQVTMHNSAHVYPETNTFRVKDEYLDIDKSIIWPVVHNINDKMVLDKINKILNFESITEDTLNEIKTNTRGLTGTNYAINYDKNNILDISILTDHMGAYPSTNTSNYSINLNNGEIIKAYDMFYQNKIGDLINILNARLQDNINKRLEMAKKENPSGQDNGCSEKTINDELQNGKENDPNYGKFTKENIKFRIKSKGIEFIYNFGFAHVIQACEPDGVVFLNYSQLKEYIRRDSLLANEIK